MSSNFIQFSLKKLILHKLFQFNVFDYKKHEFKELIIKIFLTKIIKLLSHSFKKKPQKLPKSTQEKLLTRIFIYLYFSCYLQLKFLFFCYLLILFHLAGGHFFIKRFFSLLTIRIIIMCSKLDLSTHAV